MVRTRLTPTVKCEICYERFKALPTHLRKHNYTVKTYRQAFNDAPVISPMTLRRMKMARLKSILKKQGFVSQPRDRTPTGKGRPLSQEIRDKISRALKGRKRTPEEKMKISLALMGHKVSDETRAKLSQVGFTDEHRRKLSEAQTAEKGNGWKGGKSRYLYMTKGKYRLKRIFGDPLKCFFPGCDQVEGHNVKSVDCHHLDGDHENNPLDGMNWLPLCRRHHMLADGRMPGAAKEEIERCRDLAYKAHADHMRDNYKGEIKNYYD